MKRSKLVNLTVLSFALFQIAVVNLGVTSVTVTAQGLLKGYAPRGFKTPTDAATKSGRPTSEPAPAFALSGVDQNVVNGFETIWKRAGLGTRDVEALALIYRNADGSYRTEPLAQTNEFRKFSFKWNPTAIAIVHTHPNNRDPQPSDVDQQTSDKLGVPIFTLSIHGMYMYDPAAKKVSQIQDGLDWLKMNRWEQTVVHAFEK